MGDMTHVDFDTPVDRRGSASWKWEKYRGRNIIPMWLADMDFRSPQPVIDALRERVDHGVFGYTIAPEALVNVIQKRLYENYRWRIEPEWLVWLPGLVTGLNVACRAVGHDEDDVLTAVPVYPPFLSAPKQSRRNLVSVPLVQDNHRWTFDFSYLEDAITPKTKLLLLCNPHNPVGRLFSAEELETLAAICKKHNIVICSDEIHCELILDAHRKHVPTVMASPEIAGQSITLMAPSKTFNLPGLGFSFAVIPDKKLRHRFEQAMTGIVPHINAFGFTAGLSAYRDCNDWHHNLLAYLRKNRDTVEDAVSRMPGLSMTHVEATYLAWLDTRGIGLRNPFQFFETAGVGLFDGTYFAGPGFVRLNFACPRSVLLDALSKMQQAVQSCSGQVRLK
jgi:cystathionine beta-lyase